MPPLSPRLAASLYRALSKRLAALQAPFGPGIQAVAWGVWGPLFHPALFGRATVQQHLRRCFRHPPADRSSAQLLEEAFWVLRRVDHVSTCLALPPATPAPAPAEGEEFDALCCPPLPAPLMDFYPERTEPFYIDRHVRVATYPMPLADLYLRHPGQGPLTAASACVTEGVRVTATGSFLGHTTDGTHVYHRFKYAIRIQNESDTIMRLVSRHLFFFDPTAKVMDTEVTGPGVVGVTPLLAPGEGYDYTSNTTSLAPALVMKGTFQFMRPAPGGTEAFDVSLAPLRLEVGAADALVAGRSPPADPAAEAHQRTPDTADAETAARQPR